MGGFSVVHDSTAHILLVDGEQVVGGTNEDHAHSIAALHIWLPHP